MSLLTHEKGVIGGQFVQQSNHLRACPVRKYHVQKRVKVIEPPLRNGIGQPPLNQHPFLFEVNPILCLHKLVQTFKVRITYFHCRHFYKPSIKLF
jgi:hypothetical protein